MEKTKEIVKAFCRKQEEKFGNTKIVYDEESDSVILYLNGERIAEKDKKNLFIKEGQQTETRKQILNWIMSKYWVQIKERNSVWYLIDTETEEEVEFEEWNELKSIVVYQESLYKFRYIFCYRDKIMTQNQEGFIAV